jgi:hypothetical protein
MNVFLWIVAGVLAAFFLAAGATKLSQSRRKLLANPNMKWVEDFSAGTIKLIGAAETLGALGLILPGASTSPRCWSRWQRPAWRSS